MTGDHVGGIAVLDQTCQPERLWILCLRTNKYAFPISLPVAPVKSEGVWAYRIEGATIFVQPSVRNHDQVHGKWVERFHNEGAWSVPFKLAQPEGRDGSEDFAYQQFREAPENKAALDAFYSSGVFE